MLYITIVIVIQFNRKITKLLISLVSITFHLLLLVIQNTKKLRLLIYSITVQKVMVANTVLTEL